MIKTILFNIIICQWCKRKVVGGNNIPVGKGNTFSGGIVSVGKTSCRWGKRHKLVGDTYQWEKRLTIIMNCVLTI